MQAYKRPLHACGGQLERWLREGVSRGAMVRGAGGLGLVLRQVVHRQFVASREVVPKKRWMFSETVRCSHREVDFSTDKSKTDGGSYTQVLGDRKMDAMGVLTGETKEAQELFEHVKAAEQKRSDLLFRVLSKLTNLEQRLTKQEQSSDLENLEKSDDWKTDSDGWGTEQDTVDELEVDDDRNLPGLQSEDQRLTRFYEGDRYFLFELISRLHRHLISKFETEASWKTRVGAKVRPTDWKKFSGEMNLEGGRGPLTECLEEFLQDGEMTRDAWKTLQRIWTGKDNVPNCTAQRRHDSSIVDVLSDPALQGSIRDPILQAIRAQYKVLPEVIRKSSANRVAGN